MKVKLPEDRDGRPIEVGDVLAWDDGDVISVGTLTFYGKGEWEANVGEESFADNLEGSIDVTKLVSHV